MEEKKNIHEITIKFNKEEFANAIDKAFDKKKKDIELDGFRKGKVPIEHSICVRYAINNNISYKRWKNE